MSTTKGKAVKARKEAKVKYLRNVAHHQKSLFFHRRRAQKSQAKKFTKTQKDVNAHLIEEETTTAEEEGNDDDPPMDIQKQNQKSQKHRKIKLAYRRDILLVFDLNKVLIHRKRTICRKEQQMLIMRPHAMDFLLHMSKRFALALWSSATKSSCKAICHCLFTVEEGFDKSRFLFVWDQRKCDKEEIICEDGMRVVRSEESEEHDDLDSQEVERRRALFGSETKPLMFKDVVKIWEKFPEFKNKVILIDDSAAKCERNPLGSYINPLPYNGPGEFGEDFDEVFAINGELARFLESLSPKLPMLKEEIVEDQIDTGHANNIDESVLYAKVHAFNQQHKKL
jgi:hypothetical protein